MGVTDDGAFRGHDHIAHMASSSPPAMVTPLSAAITGFAKLRSKSKTTLARSRKSGSPGSSLAPARTSLRSLRAKGRPAARENVNAQIVASGDLDQLTLQLARDRDVERIHRLGTIERQPRYRPEVFEDHDFVDHLPARSSKMAARPKQSVACVRGSSGSD